MTVMRTSTKEMIRFGVGVIAFASIVALMVWFMRHYWVDVTYHEWQEGFTVDRYHVHGKVTIRQGFDWIEEVGSRQKVLDRKNADYFHDHIDSIMAPWIDSANEMIEAHLALEDGQ